MNYFDAAMAFIRRPENDGQGLHVTPGDPGGATNNGIIYATWCGWCALCGAPAPTLDDFATITDDQITAFYRGAIWNPLQCDMLRPGVNLVLFNFACGSNTLRAARFLQATLGVPEDGQVGPLTLGAANRMAPDLLIDRLTARDEAYYETLRTYRVFGDGWTRRAEDARAIAHRWAA